MDVVQWAYAQGPLGVVVVALITAYVRKYIYTGREYALLLETLVKEREDRAKEKAEIKGESSFWRERFLIASKLADHVIAQQPSTKDAAQ